MPKKTPDIGYVPKDLSDSGRINYSRFLDGQDAYYAGREAADDALNNAGQQVTLVLGYLAGETPRKGATGKYYIEFSNWPEDKTESRALLGAVTKLNNIYNKLSDERANAISLSRKAGMRGEVVGFSCKLDSFLVLCKEYDFPIPEGWEALAQPTNSRITVGTVQAGISKSPEVE